MDHLEDDVEGNWRTTEGEFGQMAVIDDRGPAATPTETRTRNDASDVAPRAGGPTAEAPVESAGWLRWTLMAGDMVCVSVATAAMALLAGWVDEGSLGVPSWHRVVLLTLLAVLLLHRKQMYRSARSSVAALEIAAVFQVGAQLLACCVVLDQLVGLDVRWRRPVGQIVAAVVLLVLWRSVFRAVLRSARQRGRFVRPVVIVGTDEEAARLHRLLLDHVESGFRCLGVVGDRDVARRHDIGGQWIGSIEDAVTLVEQGRSTGVIVVTSSLTAQEIRHVTTEVQRAGGHVHLTTTLAAVDQSRITTQPVAFEPLLYIESRGEHPRRFAVAVKRAIDIVGATVLLTLAAPLLLVAAIAMKLSGERSILFRQERVGRHGRPFTMFKLRSMVADAEEQVLDLTHLNGRDGPLFKIEDDPRITRVGKILRATDLDEVPQLVNVLRGEMSLVGPRPALLHEVEQFDADLKRRTDVLPGITGLWQVEARESASFEEYQRLDLFYVDNQTIALDLVILFLTFESKLIQRIRPRNSTQDAVAQERCGGDENVARSTA